MKGEPSGIKPSEQVTTTPAIRTELNDDEKALILAIQNKDIEKASSLLSSGVDPNLPGNAALMSALLTNNLEMVKLLRQYDVCVDTTDAINQTPLLVAVGLGYGEIAKYLIEECKANVRIRSNNGCSALDIACSRGDLDTTKLLVENGAEVNHCHGASQMNPLDYAYNCRHLGLSLSWYLIGKGANFNKDTGESILRVAVISNAGIATIDAISKQLTSKKREEAFRIAASFNKSDVLEYYIKAGINIDRKDPTSGMTALACAAANGNVAGAEYLIKQGANVRTRDSEGNEPIMHAARSWSLPMVELLIESGANVMALNDRTEKRVFPYSASELVMTKESYPEVKQAVLAEDYWQRLTCRQQRGYSPSRFI